MMLKATFPYSAMLSIEILQTIVNLYFIGQFNDEVLLGGVGLGNVWLNLGGLYFIVALNTGLQTLCSQGFGAKNHIQVGFYYQRGVIILTITMAIITIIVLNLTSPILLAIDIDEQTVHYAYEYILNLMPGIWFIGYYDSLRNFLSAQ